MTNSTLDMPAMETMADIIKTENDVVAAMAEPIASPPAGPMSEPITPKKRGKSSTKTPTSTPAKRMKKDKPATPRSANGKNDFPSVSSRAEMTGDQRVLLKMKDEENKTWTEIASFFSLAHARTYDSSTWRKRYAKLKAELIEIEPADLAKLDGIRVRVLGEVEAEKLALAKKVEDEKKALDRKVWGRVAEGLVELGGKTYPAETVEKAFKKGVVPAAAGGLEYGGEENGGLNGHAGEAVDAGDGVNGSEDGEAEEV